MDLVIVQRVQKRKLQIYKSFSHIQKLKYLIPEIPENINLILMKQLNFFFNNYRLKMWTVTQSN